MFGLAGRTAALVGAGVLVATTALIAALVLVTSARAGGVELSSAEFVPADAGLYVALNTDLTSSQWVNTFKLIERLGEEDPEEQLRDSAFDQAQLDWETEVAPFLGGDVGIYLRSANIEGLSAEGGLIVRCKDAERALDVIRLKSGLDFTTVSYEDTEFMGDESGSFFIARIGKHLAISNTEASMREMIDVKRGAKDRLSSDSGFKSLRGKIDDDFLGFAYVSAERLAGDLALDNPELNEALEQSQVRDLVSEPAGLVVLASGDAFKMQFVSRGDGEGVSPLVAPRDSRFAKLVPADTSIFISTGGVSQVWNDLTSRARRQIDEAIAQSGEYRNLDEAMRAAGEQIGLRSLDQLIQLFTSETSIALWFPTANSDEPAGLLMAGVRDEGEARRVLGEVVRASSDLRIRKEQVGNVEVTVLDDGDDVLAYAITDGYLAFGTREAVRVTLEGKGPTLDEQAAYKKTVKELPGKLGTSFYFNVRDLLRASGQNTGDLDQAERAISGAMLNVVEQGDALRISGVLLVEEPEE